VALVFPLPQRLKPRFYLGLDRRAETLRRPKRLSLPSGLKALIFRAVDAQLKPRPAVAALLERIVFAEHVGWVPGNKR